MGLGTKQPAQQKQPEQFHYGIPIRNTATNQSSIPVPYIAGEVRLASMFIARAYNQTSVAIKTTQQSGKTSTSSTTGYKYYADILGALCFGRVTHVTRIIIDNEVAFNGVVAAGAPPYSIISLANIGTIVFHWGDANDPGIVGFGTEGEVHPHYNGICYFEFKQLYFGQGRTSVPNIEFVVNRNPVVPFVCNGSAFIPAGSLFSGANAAGVLYEVLNNSLFGAGLPSNFFDLTVFQSFAANCATNGIFISPKIDSVDSAGSILKKILEYFDGYIRKVFNVSLGYSQIQIGRFTHGATLPALTLTDDDLTAEPQLKLVLGDITNETQVRYIDHYSIWNESLVIRDNQASILAIGWVKTETIDRTWIVSPTNAQIYALERVMLLSKPIFGGTVYARQDRMIGAVFPGDLIQLNTTSYGLSMLLRIKAITFDESKKGVMNLDVEQERGTNPGYFVPADDPAIGPFNYNFIPIQQAQILELPEGLGRSIDGTFATILAARTDTIENHFIPWTTQDPPGAQNFESLGIGCAFAIHAKLSLAYGITGILDPTIGITILSDSPDASSLTSQSNQSRDAFTWLIFVGKEIMSMGSVAALGGNKFNIKVRRGVYDTTIQKHSVNQTVWIIPRANLPILTYPQWGFGELWYFKIQGISHYGDEDLTECNVYSYQFQGPWTTAVLNGVTNLSVSTNAGFVVFNWINDTSPSAVTYQIRWGAVGSAWQQARIAIKNVTASHTVSLIVPPGTWSFWVFSVDKYGDISEPVSVDFTVPTFFLLHELNYGLLLHSIDIGAILDENWNVASGSVLTGCMVHPVTYELVPLDQVAASYVPAGGTGWEVIDNFCAVYPAICSIQTPSLDTSIIGAPARGSIVPYEYFLGTSGAFPSGLDVPFRLEPGAFGLTLQNFYVHPVDYTLVPTSTRKADYVPGGGTGWETIDNVALDPNATSTASLVQDNAGNFPWDGSLNANVQPAASLAMPNVTGFISLSNDAVNYTQVAAGGTNVTATGVGRYVLYQLVLDNTVSIGVVNGFSVDTIIGPPEYWTAIDPQISSSDDGITWTPFVVSNSQFTTKRYVRFFLSWNPLAAVAPISLSSLWMLLDAPSQILQGNGIAVPNTGLTIVFNTPFRSQSSITVTAIGSAAEKAEIASQTLTGFTVFVYNNSGTAVAGTINWTAVGV